MDHKSRYIDRIREVTQPMIFPADDGYDVIGFDSSGFWTAESLRVIADYLDERNASWDHMIKEGICSRCGKAREMSREINEHGNPIFYDCECNE